MSATLLLRLDGPLQSWGVQSRYARRDTLDHPSKSGVVGICAAALGRPRHADIGDLATLRYGVLVIDPGRVIDDYHTASVVVRSGKAKRVDLAVTAVRRAWTAHEIRAQKLPSVADVAGGAKTTELTWRRYLADACFVVGLEGERGLLEAVQEAVGAPAFPLSLGRAACLPAAPIMFRERLDGGLIDAPLERALMEIAAAADAWLADRQSDRRTRVRRANARRVIVECPPGEATVRVPDQPLADSYVSRRFATRYARTIPLGVADA